MLNLDNIFNRADKIEIQKLEKIVDEIDKKEKEIEVLTDKELKNKTLEFKKRLDEGETLDDLLVEAFAVAREASKRVLGMRQYRVQLIGGIVLHQGKIAEMKTGEGKTLVGVAPVYLNALTGNGVHVVTVNDYLAKRDKEIMEKVYNFLGLSVGVILQGQTGKQRKDQYKCDITYGTNNEFGFDYLKDNMAKNKNDRVQNSLNFAIVDEIDSILIDEARTPLIIAGEGEKEVGEFNLVNTFMKILLPWDFTIDLKEKTISLTENGINQAEIFFGVDNLMDIENIQLYHRINQALRAYYLMKRDIDYVVKDGKVEIVDEFTGRVMDGRRYSEGLHQAIESKEAVDIKSESTTLATITYQNLFRMYKKLSGMTGTAKTEEKEFSDIYKLNVIQIPTNKPVIRKDLDDLLFKTEKSKFKAIVEKIEEIHKTGQPILVGTISIEKSQLISDLLNERGLKHEVLNAKNHEKEAEIISKAGSVNAITIATNMAGRGTDISLGAGNKKEEEKIKELGGLYVIGTEKHENRRIDNQLRGRSGRQGDPGVSQFYVSLEDDLMKLFASTKVKKIGEAIEDDEAIEHKLLTKSIERAQKNIESKHYETRKNVIKYDDVINQQRKVIYEDRGRILDGEPVKDQIINMIKEVIRNKYEIALNSGKQETFELEIKKIFNLEKMGLEFKVQDYKDRNKVIDDTIDAIIDIYIQKENFVGEAEIREKERQILLKVVDSYWVDHIDALDQLKKGIGLMAVGQKDPVKEYTIQASQIFEEMKKGILEDTIKYLFY
ncbi:MAG: preprotein translocase subunit SecA [Paeniclostridium sordellii]|nr:preprotein translocase subunit SecA [Paeniclostridium sordellii]